MARENPVSIVLVHGAFVDGSGWEGVHGILTKQGYRVAIVQHPTITLADDVAATKRVIAMQDRPVLLVGHSYGGVVITEAGSDPAVAGLVYIAAFAADAGESVEMLNANPPPGAPIPPILAPNDGFLWLDRAKFPEAFAADVDPQRAAFMADSQLPWGVAAVAGVVTKAAWKSRPSWYIVATEDRMVPADAQRWMAQRARSTVVELNGSHAVFVSQPDAVAAVIAKAATAVSAVSTREVAAPPPR